MASVFFSRRMLVTLLLGFSSGIPLALVGSTLQAWMASENVNLKTIGLFSLVQIPYTLKFLWAPLMDRYTLPFLQRRTGWMLLAQLLLVLSITALGFSSPKALPVATVVLCLLVSFFSSSQDIAVDAYRTDLLRGPERGFGVALYINGYRIAMLVSGSLSLIMADHLSWQLVYFAMALTMVIGMVASLIAPRPDVETKAPTSLRDAVVMPFFEFFTRTGALEILVFIVIYKLDVVMASALTTKFVMDMGFTKTDIGVVTKGFGMAATILGSLAGGVAMVKLGMKRSLWTFGITQAVSGLSFMWLARLGTVMPLVYSFETRRTELYPVMAFAIAAENFFSGMGTVAYSAFIMSLCNKKFSATQYALLTSIMALTRVLGSSPTGYLVEGVGWEMYFLIATLVAIPSLLMLLRYDRWHRLEEGPAA